MPTSLLPGPAWVYPGVPPGTDPVQAEAIIDRTLHDLEPILRLVQDNVKLVAAASAGGGSVTSVAGTAPIAVATGTTTAVVSLNNTAVTPGTYGDSTNVGRFTVDAKGRLTAASNVGITGAGGTYPPGYVAAALLTSNSGLQNRQSFNAALYTSMRDAVSDPSNASFIHKGTLTAATSTSATDSTFDFVAWIAGHSIYSTGTATTGWAVAMLDGAARGQEARLTTVTGTHQANIAAWPLGITPSAGDTYILVMSTTANRTCLLPVVLPIGTFPLQGPAGMPALATPRVVGGGRAHTLFRPTGMTSTGTALFDFNGFLQGYLSGFGVISDDITQRVRDAIWIHKETPNSPGVDPPTPTTQNVITDVGIEGWWDQSAIRVGNDSGNLVQEDQTLVTEFRIQGYRPQQFGTSSTSYDVVRSTVTTSSYEDQGESATPNPFILINTITNVAQGLYLGDYLRNSAGQQWLIYDSSAAFTSTGGLTCNAAAAGQATIRLHAGSDSTGWLVPGDTLTIGAQTYAIRHVATADNQGTALTDVDISPNVIGGGIAGGTAVTVALCGKTALKIDRSEVGGDWPTPANAAGHSIVSRRCLHGLFFQSHGAGNNLIHNASSGWIVGVGNGITWNATCGSAVQVNVQTCDQACYHAFNQCHYIVLAPSGRDEISKRYFFHEGISFVCNLDLVGGWTDTQMYTDAYGTGYPSTGDIICLSAGGTASVRQFVANSDKPGVVGDPVKLCVGYAGNASLVLVADGLNICGSSVDEAFRIMGQGGGMSVIGRGYQNFHDGRGNALGDFRISGTVVPRTEYTWSGRNGVIATTPTVTGSRSSNAALANLLTALAARGILIDSST